MAFPCPRQVAAQRPSSKGLRIDRSPGPHGWDLRPATKMPKSQFLSTKKMKKNMTGFYIFYSFLWLLMGFLWGCYTPPAMVKQDRMPSYLGRPIHGSADACREAPLQTWPLKAHGHWAIGPWPGGSHKNHQSWPTNLESMRFLDIFG